ncbi:MAG: hypothetical protein P1S60_07390 [Anaerolineae bacterium]|nr:hypothetical protein [Anaerolineae bacterium]
MDAVHVGVHGDYAYSDSSVIWQLTMPASTQASSTLQPVLKVHQDYSEMWVAQK